MNSAPCEILESELPALVQIEDELASRSLPEFIKQAWPVVEPGVRYLHNWHIDAICDHLAAVDAGEITRLLINIPPRYMKSICVSVMWPVWSWIKRPSLRWMFASYNQNLSTQHSVDRRTIIQSDWYQRAWGRLIQLTGDQNVKTEYMNSSRGVMFATSIDGTSTGKGGNRLVLDDPHDPKKAESDIQRERTITTIERKLSTRLNDKKKDAIVIVMQRVHEKDASAHALKQGGYVHLCLDGVAETKTIIQMGGRSPVVREVGDFLWPEREGAKEIEQAKVQLGPYGFACQYQQRPAPLGGGRFKSAWFKYYKSTSEFYALYGHDGISKTVKIDDCDRFATVDPAGLEKDQGGKPCYTVIQIWDITPQHNMILVHESREQMEIPDSAEKCVELCRRYDVPWIGVEQAGLGLGVVQTIRKRGVTVRPIPTKGSKEARSEIAEIRTSAGMVYFPHGAPFMFDLESELTKFPNSEYKDQVDAFAHAAIWVQKSRGAPTVNEDAIYNEAKLAQIEASIDESDAESLTDRREAALSSARAARSGEDDSWREFLDGDD